VLMRRLYWPLGSPIKTIFSPHAYGVAAIDISADALYIVTLGQVRQRK
jgi:hypothetical protein